MGASSSPNRPLRSVIFTRWRGAMTGAACSRCSSLAARAPRTSCGGSLTSPMSERRSCRPRRRTDSGASLSPDGRWLAHTSDQSGQTEVWVRPYPGPGVPVRVSTNGGIEPVWSRTGQELYYLEGQRVMAVAVSTWLDVRVQAANMALRQPLPGLRSTLVLRCRGRRPVSDDSTDVRSADLAAGGGRPQLA